MSIVNWLRGQRRDLSESENTFDWRQFVKADPEKPDQKPFTPARDIQALDDLDSELEAARKNRQLIEWGISDAVNEYQGLIEDFARLFAELRAEDERQAMREIEVNEELLRRQIERNHFEEVPGLPGHYRVIPVHGSDVHDVPLVDVNAMVREIMKQASAPPVYKDAKLDVTITRSSDHGDTAVLKPIPTPPTRSSSG